MPLSLTAIIGEKRSRSLKKAVVYTLAFAGCYAFVACIFMAITIWRLAVIKQAVMPWSLKEAPGAALFICLMYLPFILWFCVRAWVKYTHNQKEVIAERGRNREIWNYLKEHQDDILEKLNGMVVKDKGNYRNDLPDKKFTVEDLRDFARGTQELEDFEKHS